MPVSRAFRADSSRTSRAAAGWDNKGRLKKDSEARKQADKATFPRQFNWLKPKVLLESRNDILSKLVAEANTDIVNDERMRWIAAQRAAGVDTNFVIDRPDLDGAFSFLAIGDPGEADESQYVVASHLTEAELQDTHFAIVVSDVIYPTGESNDYADAFYRPYREYRQPIYALPGNHDWYSLLTGFMWNFCGAEPLPPPTERLSSYSWQERLARFLWLRPRAPERELLMAYRDERWRMGRQEKDPLLPHQPGPYFAIKTKDFLFICIDTGTSGLIDREQGEWLRRMAEDEDTKWKILLTGRPLWVDGKPHPCEIKWLPTFNSDKQYAKRTGSPEPVETGDEPAAPKAQTVNEIVECSRYGFIATIGGDVHNYQRYPIENGDGRIVQHIVSGGGGAFMSPTHTIRNVGELEESFRCYPLRGDSLARFFSAEAANRLRSLVVWVLSAALAFWWLALQAWNPDNDDVPSGVFGRLVGWLNVSPGGGYDYDRWAAVAVGGVSLAIGVALLALPWFRWRVKAVLLLATGGAALLTWHGSLLEIPGGRRTVVVAALVGAVGVVVLTRDRVRRRIPLWVRRLVIGLLVGGALVTSILISADTAWAFIPVTLLLMAIAIVLVGGPRMSLKLSIVAGFAIVALTGILFSLSFGWGALWIAVIAGLLSLYWLYALVLLGGVLFAGHRLDPDCAARYLSGPDSSPVRDTAREAAISRWFRYRVLGLRRRWWTRGLYLIDVAYAAIFDHNERPFFKSLLRIDVDGDQLKIYCFGVADEKREGSPLTVEDHVRWDGSRGRWTEARAILAENGTAPVLGEVDWFPGADLRFHLEAEQGARFTVLFSGGDGWSPAGELEYGGPNSPCELREPGVIRPRKIGLRPASAVEDAPLFAEGTFV